MHSYQQEKLPSMECAEVCETAEEQSDDEEIVPTVYGIETSFYFNPRIFTKLQQYLPFTVLKRCGNFVH